MTKYIAIFANGTELAFAGAEFRNRLDVYNHICMNRLGKKYGRLLEIQCRPWKKER